jgi:hypothetical protein
LPNGVAYYWSPHNRDLEAGFTLDREALGPDYGIAVERAAMLNAHLDAWRQGRSAERAMGAQARCGTHRKTGVVVPLPLEDDDGRSLYPELDAYLAELPRLGLPIMLTSGARGGLSEWHLPIALQYDDDR